MSCSDLIVLVPVGSLTGKDLSFATDPASGSQVKYPKLDITDHDSIERLVAEIQESQNGVDALINNAGLNVDKQYLLENVKLTLATNYMGTLKVGSGKISQRASETTLTRFTGRLLDEPSIPAPHSSKKRPNRQPVLGRVIAQAV
ncbi:hypothetical protein QFC19_002921 [Naganishia cerealis]|uniref:Uncharacterized protein n=1 Tax=Naganishia cerealis TaxID=610337 RepID=A0ACC2W7I1_9TREE|nr:hypothetical protein QFC19_002921 [Naganishia cerealis]